MLDDLLRLLEKHRQSIGAHRDALTGVETRTRMVLIDPLLTVLGWDTADLQLVIPEYRTREGVVDYALMKDDGKPWAFLEAKRLGEPLEKHISQIVNYAVTEGVSVAGLTDGDRWCIYDVFREVPLHEKLLIDISISDSTLYHCALQLLFLWRVDLTALPDEKMAVPPGFSIDSGIDPIPSPEPDNLCPLPELKVGREETLPASIHFPDGKGMIIRYWFEILTQTAEWLSENSSRLPEPFIVPVYPPKPIKYIVNVNPHHKKLKFRYPYQCKGKKMYVECGVTGAQAQSYAIRLLEICGENPNDVLLKIPKLNGD